MSAAAGARCRALFALIVLATGAPAPSFAQDPIPLPPQRDTLPVPRDTARDRLRTDTIAADTLQQDTVIAPAVRFPAMPLAPASSPARTEWVWDRQTLLREAAINLVDLLERIPGVTTFRGGVMVQPEAASAFGGTAARTVIIVDGFELDPLAGSTFDLSQIPLGNLHEVRVQRRLGLLRIILTTDYPDAGQPYTRVEAGIGVPEANLFRGLFLAPDVIVGPLAIGIERLDTDGSGRREPAGLFSGWAKWAWTNGQRGVQVEWMRNSLRREPQSPWLVDRVRQDLIVRARNAFSPRFVGEIYMGRSQLDETVPAADETAAEMRTDRSSIQAGARAGLQLPWAALNAAVRYRSESSLPVGEGVLDAEAAFGPLLLAGEASVAAWDGGHTTSYASARAEIGASRGFATGAAFAELTNGTRGAPAYDDVAGDGVLLTERSGWRAGVSLDLGRASGSVAMVSMDQNFAWPFGLPFDRMAIPAPVDAARGIEAQGRVVLWPDNLTLTSWITDWREAPGWTWLPSRSWRTALELHMLPLASGNLEIFGRVEAHMRGSVRAFDAAPDAGEPAYVTLPAQTTADAYLQIRIIDVRAFIRYEDILDRDIEEIPGRTYGGPRIFYGVKWNLWN